jgi:hypothetical protein
MVFGGQQRRQAFQFGRASALRSASDVVEELQAQLDDARREFCYPARRSRCRPRAGRGHRMMTAATTARATMLELLD